jgi:hypothetical protein
MTRGGFTGWDYVTVIFPGRVVFRIEPADETSGKKKINVYPPAVYAFFQ